MAPPILSELVDRFERNRASYQAAGYNETQVRREFLDPFFKALGWDVDNEQGHAEAYKDVIHEDAIKVGGATKAPDYCFRIGGRRIFFLEAKKPSVNVRDDVSAAFQLRRYAWSAKLPLSILSDFEELAVYDCRLKPDKADKPAVGRVMLLRFDQYVERWDELSGIFSREAVLRGSFDKFAEGTKLKRGTAEVDTAFLHEIESWRELLAKNFAARNSDLGQRDLNFAVQRTIDRVIFLRMCEDRGIENYGQLQALLNGESVYRRLLEIYDRADERYNSGLFHFHVEKGRAEPPDELTTALALDDKPLKEIIRGLYFPDSPYEFSVLPAEILGQVYEQFLGKVIRLTAGHRATVEDKPEVKKAGGVFYTPAYIVDYIVRQTVGKLVEGIYKTPKQVSKLRSLDPACGSGSFLVGAFHFLLDWHRDWYVEHSSKKEIYQGPGGQWHLTTAEKKRILLNNIYGVDIDSQAVEVTKLSLLLKVLEHENRETLERQLRLLHERALPDLAGNIKCGNSLIGPDFYDARQMTLLDEEEQYRINAFDWRAEFPEVFGGKGKEGGFDAVIGNPPYVRMEEFKELKDYFRERYSTHDERSDLYVYFIEREHELLRSDGAFGMIVSNKFVRANYGRKVRELL
ncbi:MAG TPA: DNA methyltransferase, partial [Pirellulales bacterium]|nr:DNA methyltransferase [Pirellulales bacterium]